MENPTLTILHANEPLQILHSNGPRSSQLLFGTFHAASDLGRSKSVFRPARDSADFNSKGARRRGHRATRLEKWRTAGENAGTKKFIGENNDKDIVPTESETNPGAAALALQGVTMGVTEACVHRLADAVIPELGVPFVRKAVIYGSVASASVYVNKGVHFPVLDSLHPGFIASSLLKLAGFAVGKCLAEMTISTVEKMLKGDRREQRRPAGSGSPIILTQSWRCLCSVCLEPMPDVLALPCLHTPYCSTDFESLTEEARRSCPYCRRPVAQFVRMNSALPALPAS
eukprot:CAMPEP_0196654390 /NCGR_PEP_ID=MMETSP1086-20130531/4090_1 /TAXON_ID=77921 /ORGANISM="Cyanoptyche  gloeocystis , Strain SAG4.97" /LENGTH=285 /DNA_ID=CAMNT_0041986115 /DNA_START=217 /DNA_END=1074 /DNA_ORIENTATION=+